MNTKIDAVTAAVRQAWHLGQTYWQQADSNSTSDHRKADTTRKTYLELLDSLPGLLGVEPQPAASGLAWTGVHLKYADKVVSKRENPIAFKAVLAQMDSLRAHACPATPDEDRLLRQKAAAYDEFSAKTAWVQEQLSSFPFRTLGLHHADVMTKEIERLRSATVELGRLRGAGAVQDWVDCERISNAGPVDAAIRGLLEDPTGDNATGLVRAVLVAYTRGATP